MPDIELDEHRRIHAEMAAKGVSRAIGMEDHWRSVQDFPRKRGRVMLDSAYAWVNYADGIALNKTGAHC